MKFTVGPVEMYEETLQVRRQQIPYFRTEQFSQMMLNTDSKIKEMFGCKEGAKSVYLTASGTGAMEATVINCFDARDRLLVINGGSFGERFAKLCKLHDMDYDEVVVPFEKDLDGNMLSAYENKGYTALLVNLDETSLGKLYDIELLSQFCKNNNMYLVVDAIGSAFMDNIDVGASDIDALIFSSQKALSLAPGMSFIILSERLLNDRVYSVKSKTMYFDFREHLNNFERGQTPFTPAVGICYELSEMIDRLYLKGMDEIIKGKEVLAKGFRKQLMDCGFEIPKYKLSNALTPVLLPNHAYDVYTELKDKHNIVVTPSGGDLKDKMLRIGHMGALNIDSYYELLKKMTGVYKQYEGKGNN